MVNFVVKIKLISFSPSCATLGNVPNTDIYKNTKDYKNVRHISMLSSKQLLATTHVNIIHILN